eukprot:2289148-Pleurochrysis_carterae.AAC.1
MHDACWRPLIPLWTAAEVGIFPLFHPKSPASTSRHRPHMLDSGVTFRRDAHLPTFLFSCFAAPTPDRTAFVIFLMMYFVLSDFNGGTAPLEWGSFLLHPLLMTLVSGAAARPSRE